MAPTNAAGKAGDPEDVLQVQAVRSLCDIADRTKTVLAEARETERIITGVGGGYEGHQRLHLTLVRLGFAHELGRMIRALDIRRVDAHDYGMQHLVRELCELRERATRLFEKRRTPIAGIDKPIEIDTLYAYNVDHVACDVLLNAADRLATFHRERYLAPEDAGRVVLARLQAILRLVAELRDATSTSLPFEDPRIEKLTSRGTYFVVSPACGPGWNRVGELFSRLRALCGAENEIPGPEAIRRVVDRVCRILDETFPKPPEITSADETPPQTEEIPPGGSGFEKRFGESERIGRIETNRRNHENFFAREILEDLKAPMKDRFTSGTRLVRRLFDSLSDASFDSIETRLGAKRRTEGNLRRGELPSDFQLAGIIVDVMRESGGRGSAPPLLKEVAKRARISVSKLQRLRKDERRFPHSRTAWQGALDELKRGRRTAPRPRTTRMRDRDPGGPKSDEGQDPK